MTDTTILEKRLSDRGVAVRQAQIRADRDARDVLMYMGERFWKTPEDVIVEVLQQGLSKRVPLNFPLDGMVPGVSRIFLAHRKVIPVELLVEDSDEAAIKLLNLWSFGDYRTKLAKLPVLVRYLTKREQDDDPKVVCKKVPGVFAFVYFTHARYVAPQKKGLEAVPDHLKGRVEVIRPTGQNDGEVAIYDVLEEKP